MEHVGEMEFIVHKCTSHRSKIKTQLPIDLLPPVDLKMILSTLGATSHTRLKACEYCILSLVKKAETIQVHFTPEGAKCLKTQKNYHG